MDLPPLLLQTIGSLVAIFALFGLAWMLRLGGAPLLTDDAAVRTAANEVEDGFEVERFAIARGEAAALVSDQNGRIIVIKRHGNRFAGRVLDSRSKVREEVDAIVVECGDTRFGAVRLSLEHPGAWVDAINRL